MPSPRDIWPELALQQRLLRKRRGVRLGRLLGWLCAIFALALVLLEQAEASRSMWRQCLAGLRWMAWLGAGPVACASARVVATDEPNEAAWALVLETARPVVLPGSLLCLAAAVFSGTPGLLWGVPLAWLFGALVGLVFGGLAWVCRHVFAERGRGYWLLAVLLPWVSADSLGDPERLRWLSLPGVLASALDALASLGGPG